MFDFDSAASWVSSNQGRLNNTQLLELYALYKTATCGSPSPDTPQPSLFAFRERAKWNAWHETAERMDSKAAATRYEEVVFELREMGDAGGEREEGSGGDGVSKSVSIMLRQDEDIKEEEVESLVSCVKKGNVDEVALFLDSHIDTNINVKSESDGTTALHWACDKGYGPIVRLLAQRGADVNAQDLEGMTALHYAALTDNADVYQLLLDLGANESIVDFSGTLPINS
ncbi:acyl-CoA binding domain-containing protein 6 [Chytriomyces hyalinus]|nr:acyl-CoA binding domain-containing protein 6 [Chytriomyces hyalinus]